MESTSTHARRLAQAREMQEEALKDERITDAQRERLAILTGGEDSAVTYAQYGPFDLPNGYLLVEVYGINYGIAPNGEASS